MVGQDIFGGLIRHLVNVDLGPLIVRQSDPQLYPFILAALALAVGLAVLNLLDDLRRHWSIARSLRREIRLLVEEFFCVYAVWLAFATPLDRVAPFIQSSDGLWAVLAIVLHGVLALVGLFFAVTLALTQLWFIPDTPRVDALALLVVGGLAIWGWEVHDWPLGFLIPTELVLMGGLTLSVLLVAFGSISSRVNAARVQFSLWYLLVFAATSFVWLDHTVTLYFVVVYGLLSILVVLDDVIACFLAAFRSEQVPVLYSSFLSPMRWLFTVPLLLFITVLAASGLFAPLTANPAVSSSLWIEAGAAASAFMLFRPLTDNARAPMAPFPIARLLGAVQAPTAGLISGPVVDADPPRRRLTAGPSAAGGSEASDETAKVASVGASTMDTFVGAAQLFGRLNFQGFLVFLAATYVYHGLLTNLDLSTQVNGSLVALVSGGSALATGILAVLVNERVLKRAVLVSILLLILTIALTGAAILLAYIPAANGPVTNSGATPMTLLMDDHFRLVTLHSLLQDFLVLVTAGQLGYLFQAVLAALRAPVSLRGD